MRKVLIVLTGAKEWSIERRFEALRRGLVPEFVYPHDRFSKAGYEVVVATVRRRPRAC